LYAAEAPLSQRSPLSCRAPPPDEALSARARARQFLSIWRFFRVWAMLDGMEVPDNMHRCVHNNCTFAGFWSASPPIDK